MRRLSIALVCSIAVIGLVGCSKSEAPKTPQDVVDFKGHQPTADQLQQAMPKAAPPQAPAPAPK
jgi:hypothetical protein